MSFIIKSCLCALVSLGLTTELNAFGFSSSSFSPSSVMEDVEDIGGSAAGAAGDVAKGAGNIAGIVEKAVQNAIKPIMSKFGGKIEKLIKKQIEAQLKTALGVMIHTPRDTVVELAGKVLDKPLKHYGLSVKEVVDSLFEVEPFLKKELPKLAEQIPTLFSLVQDLKDAKEKAARSAIIKELRKEIKKANELRNRINAAEAITVLRKIEFACTSAPELVIGASVPSIGQGVNFVCNNTKDTLKKISEYFDKADNLINEAKGLTDQANGLNEGGKEAAEALAIKVGTQVALQQIEKAINKKASKKKSDSSDNSSDDEGDNSDNEYASDDDGSQDSSDDQSYDEESDE